VTAEFRGVAFELRQEEAASVADALGVSPVADGSRLAISDAAGEAGWRGPWVRETPAGWSAGAHRLANALRDAFDPEFDAGSNAFHRRGG
jgi:hypothetical protein